MRVCTCVRIKKARPFVVGLLFYRNGRDNGCTSFIFPRFPAKQDRDSQNVPLEAPPLGVGSMTKRKSLSYVVYIQTSNLLFGDSQQPVL